MFPAVATVVVAASVAWTAQGSAETKVPGEQESYTSVDYVWHQATKFSVKYDLHAEKVRAPWRCVGLDMDSYKAFAKDALLQLG